MCIVCLFFFSVCVFPVLTRVWCGGVVRCCHTTDTDALAEAITKGTQCLEIAPGAMDDTPKLLEEAKKTLKVVTAQKQVSTALTKAYTAKDIKAISELEKSAKELKLDEMPGEMQNILQWHEKVVKAKQKLAVAKQQRNTRDLEDSQKQLMELGLVDDEELVGSKSITTHLKALDNALSLKDPSVILQVLGHAKKAGLEDQPKYRTCEKLVALIQAHSNQRPQELESLLQSPDLAELKTSEAYQSAAKYKADVDKEVSGCLCVWLWCSIALFSFEYAAHSFFCCCWCVMYIHPTVEAHCVGRRQQRSGSAGDRHPTRHAIGFGVR